MITITKVMVGFIILTFSACVEVETFVNVKENDTFEPLNRVDCPKIVDTVLM